MGMRQDILNQEIKNQIANIIQYKMKDPTLGFITVTRVEITADYSHAKVYLSILVEEEEDKKRQLQTVRNAAGFVKRELGKAVRMRVVPNLKFVLDRGLEHQHKIDKIIEKIKEEGKNND